MPVNSPRPKALLILGMHRSGTSAVTRVVNLLGANIGTNILLPGHGNSEGFWEHGDAMRINHYLLEAFGHTWFDIRRLPQNWPQQPVSRQALARFTTIIRAEFVGKPVAALKDPRTCLLAPLWIEAFETCGFEVQCLFMVRNPIEVVASLQAREQCSREPIFLLWSHYMMEALLSARGHACSMITYDQLLDDWRSTMQRVSEELSLTWPRSETEAASDIDAFLHKRHRHHVVQTPANAVHSSGDVPSLVAELYANCLGAAEGRDNWGALHANALMLQNMSDLYTPHLDQLIEQHEAKEREFAVKAQALDNLLKTVAAKIQPPS
jgi:hypothetical protein